MSARVTAARRTSMLIANSLSARDHPGQAICISSTACRSQNFLSWPKISHPLAAEEPAIDLVAGYHEANTSSVLPVPVAD